MDYTDVTDHLDRAFASAQDAGLPGQILDKIDDAIALVEEFELDQEALSE